MKVESYFVKNLILPFRCQYYTPEKETQSEKLEDQSERIGKQHHFEKKKSKPIYVKVTITKKENLLKKRRPMVK